MKLKTIFRLPEAKTFGAPCRATAGSAAIDLRAISVKGSTVLQPGGQIEIDTGLNIWIEDHGYVGLVMARSSLGTKGLVLANGTGVIDADYQGPMLLKLLNRSNRPIQIQHGDRVAQYFVVPVLPIVLQEVEAFEVNTERGQGGFGSTGVA